MPQPDPDTLQRLLAQQARWRLALLLVWLLALAAIVAWGLLPLWWAARGGGDGTPRPVTPRGELADAEQTTIALFRTAAPSVVNISTSERRFDYWSRRALDIPRGSGTGFIWDDAGHIVTNFHVIQGADRAQATFGDGTVVDVTVIGLSPEHDLAVLRPVAPVLAALHPLPVGTSDDLQVGQSVLAIGNPFGLDQTLTTGVISALDRAIEGPGEIPIRGVIQTDAAINPGNSGGPLLDSAGRLIGVNTAIYSPSGASAGIGFAIPVDTVNLVVPRIIAEGVYEPPDLGVVLRDPWSEALLEPLGLDGKGVAIIAVEQGGVAARAGLRGVTLDDRRVPRVGDVILAIDGQRVTNRREVVSVLGTVDPSRPVTLRIWRDGKERDLEIRFDRPATRKAP